MDLFGFSHQKLSLHQNRLNAFFFSLYDFPNGANHYFFFISHQSQSELSGNGNENESAIMVLKDQLYWNHFDYSETLMERCYDCIPRVKQQINFRLIFSQLAVVGDYLRCDMQHVRLAYQMLDSRATITQRNKSPCLRKRKIVGLKARFPSGARWRQLKAPMSLSSENCMIVEKSFYAASFCWGGDLWYVHYTIQR